MKIYKILNDSEIGLNPTLHFYFIFYYQSIIKVIQQHLLSIDDIVHTT